MSAELATVGIAALPNNEVSPRDTTTNSALTLFFFNVTISFPLKGASS
jgi:hypothetical protein